MVEILKALDDVDVGCWLYETHIEFNDTIIPKVREGLDQCCGLIVYISMHSIGSLWVQKEYGFVLEELNKPTMVVLDGSDVQLIDCFNREQRYDRVEEYARQTAAILGISSVNERIRIANEVASHVSHFMDRGGLVTLHPVPSKDEQIQQFDYGDINNIKQWAANLGKKASV